MKTWYGFQKTLRRYSALYLFVSNQLSENPATRVFFERLGLSRDVARMTHINENDPVVIDSSAENHGAWHQ